MKEGHKVALIGKVGSSGTSREGSECDQNALTRFSKN